MNMVSDQHIRGAHRPEFGNKTARSTEKMSSDANATCDAAQQSHCWNVYTSALLRAQKTQNKDDAALAHGAWLDFLLAYLPDEQQPSAIPVPALLRELL